MFRKMRNLHLWIGLITSVIILMEAVTGLMLAHPSLMGMQSRAPIMEKNSQFTSSGNQSMTTADQGTTTANQSTTSQNSNPNTEGSRKPEAGNSLMGVVKGLHAGKIGNLNIQWVIDLSAISMIILTISGIYLSVRILRGPKKAV